MDISFLGSFNTFINDFKKEFESFLTAQCNNYGYSITHEKCEILADDILLNIARQDIDIDDDSIDIFANITGQSAMSGFLLSKSLLYILEHYIIFLKEHPEDTFEHIDTCLHYFNRFSYVFEQKIIEEKDIRLSKVNFLVDNEMTEKNNIIDIFRQMKKDKKSIKFMNLYQGLPISYEGNILDIEDNQIVFEVTNELQEIVMKLKGKAHIMQNEYLPRHIKADLVYSNFYDHTVTLSNFVFLLNMPATRRKHIRVYSDVLVKVFLEGSGNEHLIGNLYDISQNGLGMISNHNAGYIGAKVMLKFILESIDVKYDMNLEGEIVNILEYDGAYRYCLKIFPDKNNLDKILDYISRRKQSIINELKTELKEYRF